MRKILAVCAILALGGCQVIKDAGDAIKSTVWYTPDQVYSGLKLILDWVIFVVTNFFTNLGGKIGL